jgi:hypothetical protein
MTVFDGTVTVTDLVAAVRRQQNSRPIAPTPASATQPELSVCIVAAHPGAGATAVAVATADALAASGQEVTLLDGADSPDAFGAVEVEIDSGTPGLRVGRRGLATVVRRDAGGLDSTAGESVMVIDGDIGTCVHRAIVCRPTLPSVGKAERLLTDGSLLAVVGASRWPPTVHASLGPAAKRATDGNRVVFFPHHRGVEIRGVDAEPTPMALLKGGSRLIELIWPDLVVPGSRRRKGLRR